MVNLITEHIDIWTAAQTQKTNVGRGRGKNSNGQGLHGIKKLRELILDLAVRGKLVPQDPNDEPAGVLLERIAKEKAQLVKEGKIKKQKPLPEITEDEKSFELPVGWEWARLPDISVYKPGKTPSTKNPVYWSDDIADIPWVSISDMGHFGLVTDTNKRITQAAVDHVFKYDAISAGTLLMSFKLTVGKISILNIDAYHNEAIISIQPFTEISRDYLFKFLPNRALSGNTKSAIMGQTLNATSLALLLVPIPPKAEQRHIVAKVDELMTVCDQLEQQQTDSNATHQTLIETLLSTLTNAADQRESAESWQRIADHFDTLFTTEHSIDKLKQTILQLAVMGKLVPQDLNDEPASVLMEKIAKEKARLMKEGKIKKQKPLPEISEDEKLFELPEGWVWMRFNSIVQELKYGTSKRSDYQIDGDPVLRIPNVVKGYIDSSDLKFTVLDEKEKQVLSLKEGDLLIIRSNGSVTIVGRPTVVDSSHVGFMYAGYLVRVRFNTGLANPNFLKLVLDSKLIRNQIELPIRTTSGVKNINSTEISMLLMPAVPLPEQQRIVAKVDELMALCDTLKARLNDAQTTQVQLADVIIEQAVA
jgi:type I restriction enzyme, S subunit